MSLTEEQPTKPADTVMIRPLEERDIDDADRIMRLAFGTYLGAPDPLLVFGDAQFVRPRFAAAPDWAFAATLDGEVVGSNFATRWGSFGFFGPLTVHPDLWGQGIANRLMEPILDLFQRWKLRQAALFTFPESPKHVSLYQKFGFWPGDLTPLLERHLAPGDAAEPTTFSSIDSDDRAATLAACRELTDSIFAGLDLEHEILAADTLRLGDTVLLHEGSSLAGFAVCHCGAGEAGSGACYLKFAAVRPGENAGAHFERLLDACEQLARARGAGRMLAGVNIARRDAYRMLLDRGYRAWRNGIIMQRPGDPAYATPDAYVIDDLR